MLSILQHVSAHHMCHHQGVHVVVIVKLSNGPLYKRRMNSELCNCKQLNFKLKNISNGISECVRVRNCECLQPLSNGPF
jgi:hypothetical protein